MRSRSAARSWLSDWVKKVIQTIGLVAFRCRSVERVTERGNILFRALNHLELVHWGTNILFLDVNQEWYDLDVIE